MSWLHRYQSISKVSSSGLMVAYHATTAGTQILQGGFKTRRQLEGRSALGGGTDNAISFTTDWAVAKGVFDGLVLAWQIANAPDEFAFIKQHFYRLPPEAQQNVIKMMSAFHGGAADKNIDTFLSGWTIDGAFGWGKSNKPLTHEELTALGYQPGPHGTKNIDGVEGGHYYNWLRPMNDKEKADFLYSYLKAYHAGAAAYDPVFFGTEIKNFKGLNRQDIGIISAEIEIDSSKRGIDDFPREGVDATHRYVDSMAEIRIYDLSTIKRILDYDTNPGNRPKFIGERHYFGEKEHFESAVNSLMDFFFKNYHHLNKYFKAHNIAIDQVISILQRHGENDRNLWTVLKSIENALDLKPLNYVIHTLGDYIRFENRIKVPPEVKRLLDILPEQYRNRIFNGERAGDVLYEMYENNKVGYDKWWTSHPDDTAYDAEKTLDDWTFDRADNLQRYESYGKPREEEVKRYSKDAPVEVVYGLAQAIHAAYESMAKQASKQYSITKLGNIFYHQRNLSPGHYPENRPNPNKPVTFFIHDGKDMHVIDGIASDSHSSLGFPYIPDAIVYGRGIKQQSATLATDPDQITVDLLEKKIVGDIYSALGNVKIRVEYYGNMYSLPDALEEISRYTRSAFSQCRPNWLVKTCQISYMPAADEFGEPDSDLSMQAYQLAKQVGIHISSINEINTVAVANNQVVGALFTSLMNNKFSFDIVVNPTFQRQGIGTELAKIALREFRQLKEDMPELEMYADVVNPSMQNILKDMGFNITQKIKGDRVLMGYPKLPESSKS